MKRRFSKEKIYYYKFLILFLVELMLAFSSMGYITINPISITFMHIPVILGALFLGPWESMILGGVFGITSMWKATVTAIFYADQVFSPAISGFPMESLFLSVGTRMLFGFCAGICFILVKDLTKWKRVGIAIMVIVSSQIHSFLVYGTLHLLFPDVGITMAIVLEKLMSKGEFFSMILTVGVILLVYQVGNTKLVQRIKGALSRQRIRRALRVYITIGCFFVGALIMMSSLVQHGYSRVQKVLLTEGIHLTDTLIYKISQIEWQLVVALVAFCGIVIILVLFMECLVKDLEEEVKRDSMTQLYNKAAIESLAQAVFAGLKESPKGIFLMMDIDYFKKINDTYGHPVGDKVLKEVAKVLKRNCNQNDCIGRIGGDEFCVLRFDDTTEEEINEMGERICHKVQEISVDEKRLNVTCSIGIAQYKGKENFKMLYEAADKELYTSKRNGRNQYSVEKPSTALLK